jgi:RNase P/RNase MRP subunit p29
MIPMTENLHMAIEKGDRVKVVGGSDNQLIGVTGTVTDTWMNESEIYGTVQKAMVLVDGQFSFIFGNRIAGPTSLMEKML